MNQPCLLCGSTDHHQTYEIQELQLGLKERFTYQLCDACGSLQIVSIPQDLGKYYPNNDYYSFNMDLTFRKSDFLRKAKTEYLLFGRSTILGGLQSIGYKPNEQYQWLKYTHARYNDSILDVGTGNGSLLAAFARLGFTNLTGIDPFINESKDYGPVKVLKKNIFDVAEPYDVIMLHHSLEHMPDPTAALQKVYELVKPGGMALVRIPIMGNYGWQTYKEYWCGLDAPRHIFIPSEKGLKHLVQSVGFTIERFYYDSYDYIIWCSEQYKKGIALHDPNSQAINPGKSMFTKEDLKAFRKKMTEENKKGNGDMAAIYLRKPPVPNGHQDGR